MYYILTCQVLGGKYSRWIVILQEFDLEFEKSTSKKSLVFVELMCDLPHGTMETKPIHSLPDEFFFLINTNYPWFGDLIVYLQNHCFHLNLSLDECRRIRHHRKYYLVINDTLYQRGIDSI